MAKRVVNDSFTNGQLTRSENGDFILTEISKDEERSYNITNILDSLIGAESVAVAFKNTSELEPDEE